MGGADISMPSGSWNTRKHPETGSTPGRREPCTSPCECGALRFIWNQFAIEDQVPIMADKQVTVAAADKPIHVTDAEFDRVVKEHPYVIVDFWAEWCAPCRAIAPIVDELAKRYAGKVTFVKLNTDENPAVPQRYMVMGIPTLLFFKDGKLVDQVVGAMPRAPFEERVKKHLA